MSKTPIEMMLDKITWIECPRRESASDLPYSTHEGVLELFGMNLRCYRLNTGQTVFNADDLIAFLEADMGDAS